MIKISPSILSADFLKLGEEILAIENASADFIHIDVMDGHFVPNLTLGPPIIRAIKRVCSTPLDVHLMIDHPEASIDAYVDAGADMLTIHVERAVHLERAITLIQAHKIKAGIALNPASHESALAYVIGDIDVLLIMSVNPGFGGQSFLPSAVKKIAAVRRMLDEAGNTRCILSVDGGINDKTARDCLRAGANCLVAGSYIFASSDYGKRIATLRAAGT